MLIIASGCLSGHPETQKYESPTISTLKSPYFSIKIEVLRDETGETWINIYFFIRNKCIRIVQGHTCNRIECGEHFIKENHQFSGWDCTGVGSESHHIFHTDQTNEDKQDMQIYESIRFKDFYYDWTLSCTPVKRMPTSSNWSAITFRFFTASTTVAGSILPNIENTCETCVTTSGIVRNNENQF